MKKTLFLFILLIVTGCGYSVAGFSDNSAIKFYINPVINETIDTTIGEIVQLTVERYFIEYGELASSKNANFFMDIKVYNLHYDTIIESPTNEALSSNMTATLDIVVTNIEGKEIFSWTVTTSEYFTLGSTITGSIRNKKMSFEKSLSDTFEQFRIRFNAKIFRTASKNG